MPTITLKAHYDGERIVLDEPFELLPNAPLMVTLLAPEPTDTRADWLHAAAHGLSRAYADDEPEYTTADLRP